MLISVEKLAIMRHFVPHRAHIPQHTHVGLEAAGHQLILRANTGTQALQLVVPAESGPGQQESWSATVPRMLLEVLERLSGVVELQLREEGLELAQGSYRVVLGCSREALAVPTSLEQQTVVEIPAEVLKNIIKNVLPAAGSYRMQPPTILLSSHAVATDGYRMALQQLPTPFPNLQLLAESARQLLLLLNEQEQIRVFCRKGNVLFQGNNFTFYCEQPSWEFPPWEKAIPEQLPHTVQIKKEQIEKGLRVLTALEPKYLTFNFQGQAVVLEAHGDCPGRYELPGVGGNGTIWINPKYLLDGLKPIAETLTLHYNDRLVSIEENHYRMIVAQVQPSALK